MNLTAHTTGDNTEITEIVSLSLSQVLATLKPDRWGGRSSWLCPSVVPSSEICPDLSVCMLDQYQLGVLFFFSDIIVFVREQPFPAIVSGSTNVTKSLFVWIAWRVCKIELNKLHGKDHEVLATFSCISQSYREWELKTLHFKSNSMELSFWFLGIELLGIL